MLVYRGQYSDAVLSELENQNDQHLEGISAKVKMLKDVRLHSPSLPPFHVPCSSLPLTYHRSPSPSATRSAPLPPWRIA